jgi:alpha-amylase
MIGDTTDGLPWKNKAVTFLENHDTGFRTNEDGSTERHHEFDSFANNWEVEQAYAYILTHPGIPSVFWKHYCDWGDVLRNKINALINARKVAGVYSGSKLHIQHNAQVKGVYASMIEGRNGELYVRVGGNDHDWQPFFARYKNYREYAYGNGWKVWVKLPNNPKVRHAPLNAALHIPEYQCP